MHRAKFPAASVHLRCDYLQHICVVIWHIQSEAPIAATQSPTYGGPTVTSRGSISSERGSGEGGQIYAITVGVWGLLTSKIATFVLPVGGESLEKNRLEFATASI